MHEDDEDNFLPAKLAGWFVRGVLLCTGIAFVLVGLAGMGSCTIGMLTLAGHGDWVMAIPPVCFAVGAGLISLSRDRRRE
jgi:hypothetical protein